MRAFWMGVVIAGLAITAASRAEDLVKKFAADLENDDFAIRDEAQQKIRKLGSGVLPDLQVLIQKTPSPELRARLAAIIKDVEGDIETNKAAERQRRVVVRAYPIKDLIERKNDLSGPSLNLADYFTIRNDSYWDGSQAVAETTALHEQLIKTVKATVAPGTWENGKFSVTIFQNMLVVSQAPEEQDQVGILLQVLRGEAQEQIEVTSILIQPKAPLEKTLFSGADVEALLKKTPAESVLLRSRVLARNCKRAVAMEGKQIEYLPETVVAATEGGGIIGGVRAKQCLEGYAMTVFPKLNLNNGDVLLNVQFYRNMNVKFRTINELEEWIHEQNEIVGKDENGAVAPVKGAEGRRGKEGWSFPSADLQALHTDVTVPKGMWVVAGRLAGAKKDGQASESNAMYLLMKAEVIEAAKK